MKSDFICWCLLTSFIGVFADERTVEQDSLVLLFENVTADNVEKEVSLFVNGVEDPTLLVTFKIVNGYITMAWKSDNYTKIFMDAKRNIWIAKVDETYKRKYYIHSSKRHEEVELTILKTNYSTTMRTTLKETTQKGDALPDWRSSETGYGIASVVLMVIILGIILVVIIIVVIVKKDHIFAWIQCKKSKSVPQPVLTAGIPQPVQVTSPCDSPNSTSYQLMWNKPNDECLLKKYILRYREIRSIIMEHEQPWPLGPFLSVDDIPASAVSYTLSPLTPGRCYQVEIQAINTQGQSCSKCFNFKTKEGVPQPVQVTSHLDSPESTSYQLMWDKPDDGGSQLLKYIIRYCEVEIIPDRAEYELSRSLNPFDYVDNILPSSLSYTLSPLTPGRYYLVEIHAINTQGRSLKCFIFKTKEGTPQPVKVISHRDSPHSESYELMWDKPDDGGSQLLKYILQYREVEVIPNGTEYELSRPLSDLIPVEIQPSDVSYILSSLKPGSYYQVEVQAVNVIGMSSKSFIFKTKEMQTDSRLPVQLDSYPTPTEVTDESNSKILRISKKIERLKPRKNAADDVQSNSKDEQNANPEWDKGPTKVESPDSNSDDECAVPLLKDQGLLRPMI